MTLHVVIQFDDAVIVYNDTLVSTRQGPRPDHFRQKLHHIRRPNMLFASSGNYGVAVEWQQMIEESNVTALEDLHAMAPAALRSIDDRLTAEHGPLGISTMYHFGYPRRSDELVRYEYSSRDGYQGQKIHAAQFFVKPAPRAPLDYNAWRGDEDVIAAAEQIQAEQTALASKDGRVLIGGELLRAQMTPEGVSIDVVHRFHNYTETVSQMTSNGLTSQEGEDMEIRTAQTESEG